MGALWELYGSFMGAFWLLYGSFMGALWELYMSFSFMGAKGLPTPRFDAHYGEIKIFDEHLHRQTSTVKVFVIETL